MHILFRKIFFCVLAPRQTAFYFFGNYAQFFSFLESIFLLVLLTFAQFIKQKENKEAWKLCKQFSSKKKQVFESHTSLSFFTKCQEYKKFKLFVSIAKWRLNDVKPELEKPRCVETVFKCSN